MELQDTVKLQKQLKVTDLAGEKVMIDFEAGKYFMIKGVGNDIWDMIQTEVTVGEIVDELLKSYDVSREECQSSVVEFLDKLKQMEFIA